MRAATITDIIPKEQIDKIRSFIHNYHKIVITTHLSPDGDALGASLALYHYLFHKEKDVKLIVPNSFPYFLKWMKGTENVLVYEYNPEVGQYIITNAELIFCIDFNVPKRIGKMAPFVTASTAKKILIDHHPYPENSCDVVISYPEISSTSELIFRLLYQAGEYEYIDKDIAECIYCGMMTDTGGFTYNSNDPEIFEIISLLLRKQINKDAIYSHVYHNYTEERFRLLGFTLLKRMKIYHDIHSALIYLSKEDQQRYKSTKGDTEGFVNYPLSIRGIVFSAFIYEDDNYVKLSFRSQGNFACNEFAAEFFQGGGHLNAAGGEFYGTLEEAIVLFETGLKKYELKLKNASC
ncbi:MAG TPA: bifunctional oligoribonuclease/PAP phosphatase NrnA [Dysgonamonadaceae bacterium]|nr:bifunctional oligoribonuclease/PAP phosphatase NrnA [Dysgonamonadaceae bacterium]